MKFLIRIVILVSLTIFIFGCAKPKNTRPFAQIPAIQNSQTVQANSIRLNAVQETALSVGAQGGLAWRARQLDLVLDNQEESLDKVFNFNGLLLKNNVLPPVLAEGDSTLNLASPDALRLADRVYKIVQAPRFVTAPPTWRDYLRLNYGPPDPPSSTLLPKTPEEQQTWNKYIRIGWQAGVDQANQIFSANLGRLKRDYTGMILYRKLLDQNMVTPPYVAKVDLGVTGDANSMRINDQVLRITSTSQLNTNSKTWKPVISHGEAGGEDQDADQADP